jgi:tetratricopeptide (TPR) repeat protein
MKVSVLGGFWVRHLNRGNHEAAYDVARQLLKVTSAERQQPVVVEAFFACGASLFHMGAFADSLNMLGKAVAAYIPGQKLLNIATGDTLVWVLEYMASCLWYLGYPDRAVRARAGTLERAASSKDPYTAAIAQLLTSYLRFLLRETNTEQNARELIATSTNDGFTMTRLFGLASQVCARLQGGFAGDLPALLDTVQQLKSMGTRVALPFFSLIASEAYGRLNDATSALALIDTTLCEIEQSHDREIEPELHRLKGEMLLLGDPLAPEEAGRCFRKAIAIARHQSAQSWELRASMSLARLLSRQGDRDEARTILAEIYNRFTEGFDTADLKEAKTLIEELSH